MLSHIPSGSHTRQRCGQEGLADISFGLVPRHGRITHRKLLCSIHGSYVLRSGLAHDCSIIVGPAPLAAPGRLIIARPCHEMQGPREKSWQAALRRTWTSRC